jgi:hypothetical protein
MVLLNRPEGKIRRLVLMVLVMALQALRLDAAPAAESREYEIKAVFLFNFAEFVDWPPQAFADATSPLVIGILGDDPFGHYIDDAVRDEKVNGRTLVIRRFTSIDDLSACHILFVSRSEAGSVDEVLRRLKGQSTLTVSDVDGFSQVGGMISLVMEKSRVRLRINLQAAKQANLRISSKLLRPAEIVSMRRH